MLQLNRTASRGDHDRDHALAVEMDGVVVEARWRNSA
jgi:hypothetical protein